MVELRLLFLDYSSDTKLNVRDTVSTSFHNCGNNHLGDHFSGKMVHDAAESFESAHSVVIALLLDVVAFDHFWDQGSDNPLFAVRRS